MRINYILNTIKVLINHEQRRARRPPATPPAEDDCQVISEGPYEVDPEVLPNEFNDEVPKTFKDLPSKSGSHELGFSCAEGGD